MLIRILKTLFVLILILAVLYFAAAWGLERGGRDYVGHVRGALKKEGVTVTDLNFGSARLLPRGLGGYWSYWWAQITPPASDLRPSPSPIIFKADALRVLFDTLSPLTVEFRLSQFSLDGQIDTDTPSEAPFTAKDFPLPVHRVSNGYLTLPALEITELKQTYKTIAHDLVMFIRTGKTSRNLEFKAKVHFKLNGKEQTVTVYSQRVQDVTYLRLDKADIEKVTAAYERPLTESEKNLICEFPMRAPTLLRLKNYAENRSAQLAGKNTAYSIDSTRHVLWSYWLARLFGADFSQRVTDAHELGSTNSSAESAKDYLNNAVGRAYAMAKKSESEVIELIKSDHRIQH